MLCPAPQQAVQSHDSWHTQRDELLTDPAAMHHVLDAVPGAALSAHDANTLRMLGSLQQISASDPDHIMAYTELSAEQ